MNQFISNLISKTKLIKPLSKTFNKVSHKCGNHRLYQHQMVPIMPMFQYVFRGAVMLSGRLINRWWRNLPTTEKAKIVARIKRHSVVIAAAGGLFISIEVSSYYSHLEECKITGRKRLMLISSDQLNAMLGDSLIPELTRGAPLLPSNHPYYKVVRSIVDSIVARNEARFPGLSRPWRLLICDDRAAVNAACLPTGELIVFSGLIEFVENTDQLAVVLAHELAHMLLEHGRESVSRATLISTCAVLAGFVLWTVVPGDFMAFLSNWFKNKVVRICIELPYSRMLESEADVLGLELMARACFKVNEARKFWELMNVFEKNSGVNMPDFLSTHPSSILRAEQFRDLIPSAQQISKENGCSQKVWSLRYFINNYCRNFNV